MNRRQPPIAIAIMHAWQRNAISRAESELVGHALSNSFLLLVAVWRAGEGKEGTPQGGGAGGRSGTMVGGGEDTVSKGNWNVASDPDAEAGSVIRRRTYPMPKDQWSRSMTSGRWAESAEGVVSSA